MTKRLSGLVFNTADAAPAVPASAEEMAEFVAEGGLAKVQALDLDAQAQWFAGYNKAVNKADQLGKNITSEVQAGITQFLKDNGVTDLPSKAEIEAVARTARTAQISNASYNPAAPGAALDGVYESIGQFVHDVVGQRKGQLSAEASQRLDKVRNAYSGVDPADGGFLIPEEQRAEILQLALEQSVVRSRAATITMGSRTQTIPFVDATTNSGSVFGGMVFYWTPESGSITQTEAKFGRVKLEASKLTGSAAIPNELFADAPALSSWLNRAAPAGLAFYEDQAFLTGSGAGQPLGVFDADNAALLTITKETNQADNTVVADNIFKMFARMLPQSLNSAVWVVNQTVLPQLLGLSVEVGTGGSHLGLVQRLADSPTLTMLGRPIVVTEKVPALGSAGDVAFVDFNYYLLGDRQAVSIQASEHANFTTDETVIKIVERTDGRPWVQSALTPLNGDTVSPYVRLGARS